MAAALQAPMSVTRYDGSGTGERPDEREKWSARAMAASAKDWESSAGGATQAKASMVQSVSSVVPELCKRE